MGVLYGTAKKLGGPLSKSENYPELDFFPTLVGADVYVVKIAKRVSPLFFPSKLDVSNGQEYLWAKKWAVLGTG